MDIRDSQRIKEIRDNTKAMAEAFSRIANTLADALELYISTRTETQTETQNSNLTFEKDECAKEYEELGLKELKELIEADRKTEPFDKDINVRSKDEPQVVMPKKCKGCDSASEIIEAYSRDFKDGAEAVKAVKIKALHKDYIEPYVTIEDEPKTETEIAKAIVHKMIDNSVIAEDAYPDLRQRMHEAVERLDEYYPSENGRSE